MPTYPRVSLTPALTLLPLHRADARKALLVLAMLPGFIGAQTFDQDIVGLDRLRDGTKTPLSRVESRALELLERHRAPEQHGQIYYQLAHTFAQSGQQQPDKTIEYAKRALEFRLTPQQRLRLHVYAGDASRLGNDKPAAKRKAAAIAYLQGLQEIEKRNLPDSPSKPPPRPAGGPTQAADQPLTELQRNHRRAMEAWQEFEMQRDLLKYRDMLVGQLVDLYARRPIATEELNRLTDEMLTNASLLQQIKQRVTEAIAKLPPALGRVAKAGNDVRPSGTDQQSPITTTISVCALILTSLCAARRYLRMRRASVGANRPADHQVGCPGSTHADAGTALGSRAACERADSAP